MKTSWAAALAFSASIHGLIGYSFWATGGITNPVPSKDPIPIQISYVPAEAPPPKPIEYPKPRPASKKKKVEIPAELPAVKSQPKLPAEAKAAARQLSSKTPAPAPAASPAPEAAPKTASDFMGDPEKGKVFLGYFGQLKEKIQLNLRRRYNGGGEMGVVTLFFVLNPDGTLVRSSVAAQRSDAGPDLQRVALDSLKRSAPFGAFPKELGKGAVAFSLKVFFDDED